MAAINQITIAGGSTYDVNDKRITTSAVSTATHFLATDSSISSIAPITAANLASVLGGVNYAYHYSRHSEAGFLRIPINSYAYPIFIRARYSHAYGTSALAEFRVARDMNKGITYKIMYYDWEGSINVPVSYYDSLYVYVGASQFFGNYIESTIAGEWISELPSGVTEIVFTPTIPSFYKNYSDIAGLASALGVPRSDDELLVDLGLPSGNLWATRNVDVTRQNGFAASPYQYECSFFSWGNTFGVNPISSSAFSYNWGTGTYASTSGASLTADAGLSDDFGRFNLGGEWRLPTTNDFAELFDSSYTKYVDANGDGVTGTNKLVTVNGVVGIRLMSLINGKTIFFPCSGNGNGTSWDGRGAGGYYWSSSLNSATQGRRLGFNSGGVNPQSNNSRFYGYSCRPVASKSYKDVYPTLSGLASALGATRESQELIVDLGLPSGRKWATHNIDVTMQNGFTKSIYQYECSFFSWGNTFGVNPISSSAFSYNWGTGNDGPYASTPGASLTGNAGLGYDAAFANLGNSWRLPTTEDFAELFNSSNTKYVDASGTEISGTNKLTTINGIKGICLMSKANGKTIFFPCSGYGNGTSCVNRGSSGDYWSSSLYSSTNGRGLSFNSGGVDPQNNVNRFYGFVVRPVQ